MTDLDLPSLALGLAAGALAGAIYLALLWISVSRLAGAQRPIRALLSGMALRLVLVLLAVHVLLMDGDPLRVAAALAGFLAMRIVVTRMVGRRPPAGSPLGG